MRMKAVIRASRLQGFQVPASRRRLGNLVASAFTLIELLVVIVIIGVLAALVMTVAVKLHQSQKVNTTRNTMRLVILAVDQFTQEDPLKDIYDNPRMRDGTGNVVGRTFGPYPPYQLANAGNLKSVPLTLERYHALSNGRPVDLNWRLARDLSGTGSPAVNAWSKLEVPYERDDIRALYAYLAAYSPGVLTQIPDPAKKRLPDCPTPNYPEMINPTGQGTNPGSPGAIDVLGIYDSWDVPLDYLLYVKLEFAVAPDTGVQRWTVTDRMPVLRSRAITQEEVDAEALGTDPLDPQKWIFSTSFPLPAANVDPNSGAIRASDATGNGWARLRAGGSALDQTTWDNYTYVPQP
jgi:prepilin-type N-terminal cleavage/methylation domain-containing protein